MEIWNLVFMQFDRDASGKMSPLPKPSVDTGAGLERITAILEGKNNNYDTDLFAPIIGKIEQLSGKKYIGNMVVEDAPFRVIADHARAATMLMVDGVIPSNEGRGYVLRRIIRRAIRYGRRLGIHGSFLHELPREVWGAFLGVFFAEHGASADPIPLIEHRLRDEEDRFAKTMTDGADRVGEEISAHRRAADQVGGPGITMLGGVFRLYDTYGVPLELIEEIAREEGLEIDREEFESELKAARERSKGASRFEHEELKAPFLEGADWSTEFLGYPEQQFVSLDGATVKALFEDGLLLDEALPKGEEAWAILNRTVFYPEGGGQVADVGSLIWKGGQARVVDVRRILGGQFIAHRIHVEEGLLRVGVHPEPDTVVNLRVDEWARRKTQANHTGTHLLHAVLRKVLGESVRQMGSLVAPDRLRFDYAASKPTTPQEIREIERLVNEVILRDLEVTKENMPMEAAKKRGAMMFFDEKYGETVRVVDVPGFSTELCGGCHVNRTGEIGSFKVISDKGLAAGVRRIEALTSLNAVERLQRDEEILAEISQIMNAQPHELPAKLKETLDSLKRNEKEIAALKREGALSGAISGHSSVSGTLTTRAWDVDVQEIAGVKVLARRVPSLPTNELRNLADTFRSKLKSGVVLLGTELDGKVTLLAAVTSDLVSRVSAHELAQVMAPAVGGKGGGKPDLAQAGGKDAAQIEPALELGVAKVRERLST
jgi:alanyl-tRNA synthetase